MVATKRIAAAAGALIALASGSALALAQRTFVSVAGSDMNACSVANPCRSFGAAIAQTAVGGEVVVLDSGGYGPVSISQSVSIVAPPGVYAGISVSSSAAININGTGTHAELRGLTIEGSAGGFIGIQVQAPDNATVLIERCVLRGFSYGLFAWGTNLQLVVRDTEFARNGRGIELLNGTRALLERVLVHDSVHDGLRLHSAFATGNLIDVTVRDSVLRANERGIASDYTQDLARDLVLVVDRTLIAGHSGDAVYVSGQNASTTELTMTSSVLANNVGYGIHAHCVTAGNGGATKLVVNDTTMSDQGGAAILITGGAVCTAAAGRNTLARNNVGLYNGSSGSFVSFGNNQLVDNGLPTLGTITPLSPQ